MKKKIVIISSIVLLIVIVVIFYKSSGTKENVQVDTTIVKGVFEVSVTTTGELQAQNSVKILGPSGLQRIYIYEVKITDLIPEGTLVDSGDYVATLDRTEVEGKLKDVESELEKQQSQFIKTQLDTTLDLRTARDELVNLKYAMEEAQLTLDQSKFETPATIRQATITLDKAKRAYEQAQKNYDLKVEQSNAKMVEVTANLTAQQRKKDDLVQTQDEFVIKAPKAGMVIYMKEWGGTKRKVGSSINPWDPAVATLPDLSSMVSKTYINEIDISKIKLKQKVIIGVDAFPDKKYDGEIVEIANVGEQLPNSDAKVFEVSIKINVSDSILKPSMTTGNKIIITRYENALHLPLEAVHSNDSMTYVYKRDGISIVKQVIETGESNENEIIVLRGLNENDVALLSQPENSAELEISGMELFKELRRKKELKAKNDSISSAKPAVIDTGINTVSHVGKGGL